MDILGIGTEIVECPRIGRMIEAHGEAFLRRIYTDREIRYCHTRKHAIEHFAGLWAAKGAIFKALGTGRSGRVSWTDIEVRDRGPGRHQVRVAGEAKALAIRLSIADILVTISHCRTYATAYAMVSMRPGKVQLPPSDGLIDDAGNSPVD